jgi:hypothetical protein
MPAMPADKGPHYELIKHRLPAWLRTTAWPRAHALGRAPLALLPELIGQPAEAHAPLKVANAHAWTTQNSVDHRLQALQDVYGFAEPLLVQALQTGFGLTLDVRATHLFLHTRTGTLLKGTTSRTVSLLEAALHNFASSEQFTEDSCYISRPDARGHFMIEPLKARLRIEQFIALCRELDLGARYQQHLREHVLPADSAGLQAQVIASQQAALHAAAHLARLRGQIDEATFHLLQRTVKGERGLLQFYRLMMQDTVLTGILLIAADLDQASAVVPVVAYIPHDPDGAIQVYASTRALRVALLHKLQDRDYQRFFSQFVDHAQRGHFFSGLQQRPRFGVVRIDGELWPQRYQHALDKILNDGRALAVSTADADSHARWAWWDNVNKILGEILNAALLVATPFVPLLGETMLAYTAWQVLDEVVEGVVDLAEGQVLEAAGHLVGVVSDVVQLATFSVGGELAQSLFINQLKAVPVNGTLRLWNPDPRPYRQTLRRALDSSPDERGLHHPEGQPILPVNGYHYAVQLDPANADHRILHPRRREAYAPPLHFNDTPRAWSHQRQLRELGPFDTEQQQQIIAIAGLDPGTLRTLQTEQRPAPVLDDTLKRMRLAQQARDLPERLRNGEPVDQETYWSPHMAVELAGWPADWAIQVYEDAGLHGDPLHFGAHDAPNTVRISHLDLNRGRLPERLVDALDPAHLHVLLGDAAQTRAARIESLRHRLADNLADRYGAVFDYLYRNSEHPGSEAAVLLRETFADLPRSALEHVLRLATPTEHALLLAERRVPLRLKNLARELRLQSRAAHSYQGFYDAERLDAGTERMVLGTLKLHSAALLDSRIEVRRHTPRAGIRASAGAADARYKRVLVRTDGHYQVYDEQLQVLQPPLDFFDALLHALPAPGRAALGFTPGEGARLKGWVMERLHAPAQRRTLLATPESGSTPAADAEVLLQKPMLPLTQWVCDLFPPTLHSRVKALYPYASPSEIDNCLASLDDPLLLQRFEAREVEKVELQTDLSNWINNALPDEHPDIKLRRADLASALLRTWEHNIDPGAEGTGVSMDGVRLSGLLGTLRMRADFSHVQHLDMVNGDLLDHDTPFLTHFPRLVSLNLRDNVLSQLPAAIADMTSLTELTLDGNPIQWDPASLEQISRLRQLRHLSLANNRDLTDAPHLGRLPHLHSLSLRNTGVTEWPSGLFEPPRPAHFALDLQHTAIRHVPHFLPWQAQAELIARARLDRNHLTPDAERQVISYRLGAGLDPYRSYPPKGDAAFWLALEREDHQPWLQQLWDEVEQEHGAQGLFEVLKSLEPPDFFETQSDAQRYQRSRQELTSKVWRLLLAVQRDQGLRTRLFTLASNPVTCADAGAHVFNAMGVEVLLAEINRDLRGILREVQLAHLARGKSRLERLNHAAQADIRRRIAPLEQGGLGQRFNTQMIAGVPGSVDEVEVYLAYQSGLKRRLDLPWVSEHMTYRLTARVDDAQLNDAYDQVIRQEAEDGLADGMLEQPFWDRHLRERHAAQFQASLDHANTLIGPLDDLMFAQNEWADAQSRAGAQHDALRQRLLALADALNVPHAEVLTGQPMTVATYERLLAAGFTPQLPSEQDLARQLTRQALSHLSDYESGRGTPMPDE